MKSIGSELQQSQKAPALRESDQEKPLKTCMTQTGGGGKKFPDINSMHSHVTSIPG